LEVNMSEKAEDDLIRLFMSYSRKDCDFVAWLASELNKNGCLADFDLSTYDPANITTGISAEDPWWPRTEDLITSAQAIVFIVSPDSLKSEICSKEIAFAKNMGKRIFAVLYRPTKFAGVPPHLSEPNVKISFAENYPGQAPDPLRELVRAVHTDVEWHRNSARLTALAKRWAGTNRPEDQLLTGPEDQLLRGVELWEAEAWAAAPPASAPRHARVLRAFLDASHKASDLRERAPFLVRATRPVALYFLGGALILLTSGLVALVVIKMSAAFGQDYLPLHQEAFVQYLYTVEFFIYVLFIRRKYRLSRYGYFSLDGRPCGVKKYAMRWLLIPAGLIMTPWTRCFAEAKLTWVDQKTGTELVSIKRDGSRRDGKVPPAAAVKLTWKIRAARAIAAKVPGGLHQLAGVRTPAAVTGPPPVLAGLTGAPGELTASPESDQAVRHADAAVPHRRLTRRHVAYAPGVLVLVVAATGAGLWLSSSSSPTSAAPLKVNTCARTASGSVTPALLGSITVGATTNDFVDVAFSPDCQVVAAGGNGIVQERNLVTGRRIATMPAAPGNAVDIDAFTPNGNALAVAGGNGYTTLWNAATGRLEARFPSDPTGGTYCLVISPDGTEIFTGGSTGVVRIWGVNTRRSTGEITTGVAVGAMTLSPNGKLLAVGGYDGTVRIYDTASHAQVATLRGDEGHIWSMAFSPDGSTLAVGSNVLQWWDVATSKLIADENSPGGDVTDVAFSPDGKAVAAGGNEMVGLWDARTRRLIITMGLATDGTADAGSYPNGMSFSRYGAVLAFGYRGTVQFWNVARI
jgi:WD40 repeat protein